MKADEHLQVKKVPYQQMCIDIIYTSKFQINIFRKKNGYIKINEVTEFQMFWPIE